MTAAGRRLIVIVDDQPAVRLVTARVLIEAGYDVLTAPDGLSAVAVIEGLRAPPDLVITDLRMPVMGGEALASWLAARLPRMPLIFITGFGIPTRIQWPVLRKPFTAEVLCAAVRQVLDHPTNTQAGGGIVS